MQHVFSRQSGFSLVELSIVLVILGLLAGGVLGGRSLIRAAELRAATTEFSQMITAVRSFQIKFHALPGDMPHATRFWGAEPPAHCPGNEQTPSLSTATCNGNGNGMITWQAGEGFGAESFRFWQHLSNANLLSGQYSGVQSGGGCNYNGSCNVTLGWNVPASRLANAGWSISYLGRIESTAHYYFAGNYGNTFHYGSVNNFTTGNALTPAEAWSIDHKQDDGSPATGHIRSWRNSYKPNCTDSDIATAQYRLEYDGIACPLTLMSGF